MKKKPSQKKKLAKNLNPPIVKVRGKVEKKSYQKQTFKYIESSQKTLEEKIINCLFKPISNRLEEMRRIQIEPGDRARGEDSNFYTVQQKRLIKLNIEAPIIVKSIPKYEFIPYPLKKQNKERKPIVKDGLVLVRELTKEIESYLRIEDGYNAHYQSKLFGLDNKDKLKFDYRKKVKEFEEWLYPKNGLKQAKKEMIGNLFHILNDNITNPISHRMQSHYIAKVLIALNIKTGSIRKIESDLQAQHRKKQSQQ